MQLGAWVLFALVLFRLRYFYGVMLGTFVMSYMGNSAIEVCMRKGNNALKRWVLARDQTDNLLTTFFSSDTR